MIRSLDVRLKRLEAVSPTELLILLPGMPLFTRAQVTRLLREVDGKTRGIPLIYQTKTDGDDHEQQPPFTSSERP